MIRQAQRAQYPLIEYKFRSVPVYIPGLRGIGLSGSRTLPLNPMILSETLNREPIVLLMDKILHDPKDPKLWELWYIPYNG